MAEIILLNQPGAGLTTAAAEVPAKARTLQSDERRDVISPYRPWAGAYAGLNRLPSPMEIKGRPWFIPEHIKWLMLRDSQVFAGYMLWKTAVLVDGMQIYPSKNVKDSSGKISKERQKKAAEICDNFLYNIHGVRGGIHSKNLQLLDSSLWGHKAASIVCKDETRGRWKGKLSLDYLRIMDNADYRVKTDKFGVVKGLQPIDANGDDEIYDISRFARAVFRPYDDHPLGTNIVWPIYNAWYEKQQIAPERLANMAQFGSPSIWASAPQQLTDITIVDKNGLELTYPQLLPNGQPHPKAGRTVTIPINKHILSALEKFEGNGSAVVLPFESKLNLLEAQGDGQVFRQYSDDKDSAIIKGIFFTTSWTESERYGSNAKSKTSASIGNCSIMDGKKMLASVIQDIAKSLISYNFGDEYVDLVPEVTFGNVESSSLSAILNSIAALWSTGFFDESQREGLCRMLGLPMPDANQKPVNQQTPTGNVLVNNNDKKNQNEDEGDEEE